MAKKKKKRKADTSFNFGANVEPKKKKNAAGSRSWWTAYTGGKRR
jgi:hypothetical protein